MSLLVHLPLNGNLENKGLADVTINGSPTFSSSGKIGNCLTNGDISITCLEISQSKIWSVCFWSKVISELITSNWTLIMKLNDGSSNLRVEVCPSNYSDGRHCYSIANNIGYKILNGYIQSPIGGYYDKWIHFTLTSDGSTIKRFIDGTFIGSTQYTGDGAINGIFTLNNNNKINKNDFRIYNHCLSPKEVKEISKGLILHYPLDDVYDTGLVNKYSGDTFNGLLSIDAFTRTKLTDEDGYNYKFSYVGNGTNTWRCLRAPVFTFNPGVHQYSLYVRCNSKSSTNLTFRASRINNDYHGCASVNVAVADGLWHRYELSLNILTTHTYNNTKYTNAPCIELYTDNLVTNGTTYSLDIDIKWVQVVESPTKVPVINNNFRSNIISDSSGFGHDGTVTGTLTINNDSPRYTKSTVFNNAGHIYSNVGYNLNQDKYLTVSCWFYLTDRTGYLGLVGNRGTTGSSNSSSPLNWYLYTHTTDGSLQLHGSAQNKSTIIPSLNTWHHVTAVIKNNVYDMYLDGEKVISNVSYTWGSVTQRFVVSGYGTAERFKGRLSDVRVYATALSEDDVKELYNTSAFITNNGTTECYEFDETGSNPIVNKTGVVKVGNLYEDDANVCDEAIWTGNGVTNSNPGNAVNQCTTAYTVTVGNLIKGKKYNLELDFTWIGDWSYNPDLTSKFLFQGANDGAWSGTNYMSTALNAKLGLLALVKNTTDGGSYHYKVSFTIPEGYTYNKSDIGTRSDYKSGNGTFSISNLKIYPADADLDTEQTKFGSDFITSKQFNEI